MQVLFLRHAHAIDGFACKDEHRWLSEHGRDEAKRFGQSLRQRAWFPSLVWMSPKVRAVQTCELVLQALVSDKAPRVEVWPDLAYGTTAKALACLEQSPESAKVLLVGHEPLIRSMAAHYGQTQLDAFSTASGALIAPGVDDAIHCEIIR